MTITKRTPRTFRNQGVIIHLDPTYQGLLDDLLVSIHPLWQKYPKAYDVWRMLINDPECQINWDMADYLTVHKLGYNDHGMTHAMIVGANAVRIFDLLVTAGVQPDIVKAGIGENDDACVAVVAGALLHDIGNQVHRDWHPHMGVSLALPILNRILQEIYPNLTQQLEIRAFILHAIISHDFNPNPLTFEAGLVSIADGSDITKGRGRKAFSLGKIDIHSISALAIDTVEIRGCDEFPVEILVTMNNSAGLFQIEDTLTKKIVRGPLSKYITVTAITKENRSGGEERIIERLRLQDGSFKPT
jgi:metal-dependent HD superfamily phosphatase/phosphodiesterase